MLEELRLYSKYLALVVAIVGLFKYKDYAHTKAKYFLYSVWYIVFTEFLGTYFYRLFNMVNYSVYNIYMIVQFAFYLWWIRLLIQSEAKRKILAVFIIVFVITDLIDNIFMHSFLYESSTYAYTLGVVFVVIAICFYLIEQFNSENILTLTSSKYFWFLIGILIFNAAYLPFKMAFKYFLFGDVRPLSVVNFVLCVILYSCFVIGFLKAKPTDVD